MKTLVLAYRIGVSSLNFITRACCSTCEWSVFQDPCTCLFANISSIHYHPILVSNSICSRPGYPTKSIHNRRYLATIRHHLVLLQRTHSCMRHRVWPEHHCPPIVNQQLFPRPHLLFFLSLFVTAMTRSLLSNCASLWHGQWTSQLHYTARVVVVSPDRHTWSIIACSLKLLERLIVIVAKLSLCNVTRRQLLVLLLLKYRGMRHSISESRLLQLTIQHRLVELRLGLWRWSIQLLT